MAVDLSKLISKRRLDLEELKGKIVAIDAYNFIYQFLSIIRQPDGTPLVDSKGNVTSHLSGIFFRTAEMISKGIKPVYVFDGIPSMLKQKTINARMNRRNEAMREWEAAKASGNLEEARQHAMASTRITKEIVASAKELLENMGVAYIDAPSEGEAQASHMCKKGVVDMVASQDYDTMLFGAPLVVRNLTFSGRRKLPKRNIYIEVYPELVSLEETLKQLGLTQSQLIWVGMMLGTDFNDGIKGIGPKTAVKIAKEAQSLDYIESIAKEKYKQDFEVDPKSVERLFIEPEVKEVSREEINAMLGKKPDMQKLMDFMCKEHGFAEERISKYAQAIGKSKEQSNQRRMDSWF
ncbi:MAG: flap endonuclease-1 [Candidatus Micrarchaeia archaeon]